jgi:hypothetical protein
MEFAAAAVELEPPAAGDDDVLEVPPHAARETAARPTSNAAETGVEGMARSLAHRT